MASDSRIKDDLATILDRWTICDLYEAHVVLDALDRAEERARRGSA